MDRLVSDSDCFLELRKVGLDSELCATFSTAFQTVRQSGEFGFTPAAIKGRSQECRTTTL